MLAVINNGYPMLHRPCLLATVLCALASASRAADYDSWYVGLDLLASFPPDLDAKGASTGSIALKNSVTLGDLKVGYRPQALFTDKGNVRLELELATRGAEVDSVSSAGQTTAGRGTYAVGALMLNAFYDLHTGGPLTPYIGGGLGIAAASFSKTPGLGITEKGSTDSVWAAQVSIGVSYSPDWLPGTDWSLGYNLFHAGEPSFKATGGTVKLDALTVSSVQLGFKYHF